jgi:outer membrane protein OmpA-like peptidoglycan-associated protein
MKKITLLCFFLLSIVLTAQEEELTYNKWLFKVGANIVDNSGDINPLDGFQLSKMGFSQNFAGGIEYRFHRHWSVGVFVSNNKFKANKAVLDKTVISEDENYFATDLNLKYYLWGAEYENRTSNKFNMYLSAGVGSFKISENTTSLNFGGGLVYWFSNSFGVNLESVAKWDTNGKAQFDTNHFQHFIGITYRNNSKKDSDKDGVFDEDDKCPEIFGLKEFMGCPDTDNDGIADSEDACPNTAGLVGMNGCPDTDGDGIVDKDDSCPNAKGTKTNNGCPDTDGDGIVDTADKCPGTSGIAANNGCPWPDTDGDGVLDKDDKCANVAGLASNNGCPEVRNEAVKRTNKALANFSKSIYFDSASTSFKSETYAVLKKVRATLEEFPKAMVIIEGHTDNTGSSKTNQKLSQKRANAVKNYLVNSGIAKENIIAIGYGQNHPIASNTYEKGRVLNRRVIIKVK